MSLLLFHAKKISTNNSGLNRETLPERADGKSKLTCSVCLKEFKSLPALNGHMRSHGGVRTSPNFKQVAIHFTSVFDSLLYMLMFACFATLCFAIVPVLLGTVLCHTPSM